MLLALIGKEWLRITDAHGRRRLDNPDDFVRLEIEAALTRNVRVIPILVDGASMPRANELPDSLARLVRRQALELSPARFDLDTGRLLKVLDRTLAEVRTEQYDAASRQVPTEHVPDPRTTEVQEASKMQSSASSDEARLWRVDMLDKTRRTRTFRVVLTHESHIIAIKVGFLETISVDGELVRNSSKGLAETDNIFELTDGDKIRRASLISLKGSVINVTDALVVGATFGSMGRIG